MPSITHAHAGPPEARPPWRLVDEIIARSGADDWHEARREWELDHVFMLDADECGTCLCGHTPIRECCVLANRHNGAEVIVGNCCVKRFMQLPSEAIFAGLRRIAEDPRKAPGTALVEFATGRGWLSVYEQGFLRDTARRRSPSAKVLAIRQQVNAKLLRLAGRGVR
jgi:hypothetical protein